LLPRFTNEIKQEVYEALHEAAQSHEHYVDDVLVVPAPVAGNWRESLTASLKSFAEWSDSYAAGEVLVPQGIHHGTTLSPRWAKLCR
jgi:hypothetical protein